MMLYMLDIDLNWDLAYKNALKCHPFSILCEVHLGSVFATLLSCMDKSAKEGMIICNNENGIEVMLTTLVTATITVKD